jgi:hypothetical protein
MADAIVSDLCAKSEKNMLHELWRCDVAPGRRPALLQRFETFTARRWQELGIHLLGCWTPAIADNSSQLIVLLGWDSFDERTRKLAAWEADAQRESVWQQTERDGPLIERTHHQLMAGTAYSPLERGNPLPDAAARAPWLFELRDYLAMPGRQRNVVDRFGQFVSAAFTKHGFHQVGYWTNVAGGHDHQLLYLLAWESLNEREAKFDAFLKDPLRVQAFAEQEKDGPIVQQAGNSILRPTSFSPLR